VAVACSKVLELLVPGELPIIDKIHYMAARFYMAQEEATRGQSQLNLKIAELTLKAQPPTPPEV